MGKHIICSGCSFTRQEKRIGLDGDSTNFYMDDPSMWRWPHWIQKLYPKKIVYNIGNPTNGNNLIAVSTIHKVTELLKLLLSIIKFFSVGFISKSNTLNVDNSFI